MTSIFTSKESKPKPEDLRKVLAVAYRFWEELNGFVKAEYKDAMEEWNFSNPKYGWNFRLKEKKRVIIYLQPQHKYFIASFVFGQKAMDAIMRSAVADSIKTELTNAKIYAEGRGIRIEVRNKKTVNDIKLLIQIKLTS